VSGVEGDLAAMGDGGCSEVYRPPAQKFWKNVRTKRTKRTKSVRRCPTELVRGTALRPACQRGGGLEIPFSRANAGIGAGVGRIWDGHVI
jgi:hypothetical protein